MKCPKCQADNPDTQNFCGECGTKISQAGDIHHSFTRTLETPVDVLTRGTFFADRYEIIEKLGEGGMGAVYRVEDTKVGEEVALKLINPLIASDKKTIERFRNELKFARKIRHKHVCQMFDLGESEEIHFITMEYVAGEDLKSLLKRTGKQTIETGVRVAKQVTEGLAAAHGLGIVHRDLKPSNIMIDKEGNARIMDFGIARSMRSKGITGAGLVIGTPEYMSPEQAEGKEADSRADIYSLGVVLFQMLTGQLPFEGETSLAIAHKHIYEPAPDPLTLNSHIPEDLGSLILRCLEKDKEARYQKTSEMLTNLEEVLASLSTAELTSKDILSTKRRPGTSKTITVNIIPKKLLLPASALTAIIVAIISLLIFLPKDQKQPLGSIAVLPFRLITEDRGQEFWDDGMTAALTNKLYQVSGLKRVASFRSAMTFKGSDKKAPEIGQELGVDALVDGTVNRSENKISVNAQLIEAKGDKFLWAGDFSCERDSILTLHNAIAKAIVAELSVNLTSAEEERLSSANTVKPELFEAYEELLYKSTEQYSLADQTKTMEENLIDIIQQDPEFALPYIALATVYFSQAGMGVVPTYDGFIKCREMAEKAVEIDSTSGDAHAYLGITKVFIDYNWEDAEKEFALALKLAPNDTHMYNLYGYFLAYQARFDEAIQAAQRSIEIDPLQFGIAILGWIYYHAGRYDDAIVAFKESDDIWPNSTMVNEYLLTSYLFSDLKEETRNQAEIIMSFPEAHEDPTILAFAGYTYGVLGQRDKATNYLDMLHQLDQKKFVDPHYFAYIHMGLGDKNHALECLEKAYEERTFLAHIKVDPIFYPLHAESRFQSILKNIGLGEEE